MKATKAYLIRPLFAVFSFLADKTNGWTMFVRPKFFFGSLLLGMGVTTTSCIYGEGTSCYLPQEPQDSTLMCYDVATTPPADTTTNDTASPVMCYEVAYPTN